MMTGDEREYHFTGTATVSVSLTVEASSRAEAIKKAREATELEWECPEVDGAVTIIEADGEPVPKPRSRLKCTSTWRMPPAPPPEPREAGAPVLPDGIGNRAQRRARKAAKRRGTA